MTQDTEEWSTNKAVLAAYLQMMGMPIIRTEWEDGSCYWKFDDTDELADAVADFEGGKALVDPNKFNDVVADIKRSMFIGTPRTGVVKKWIPERGYGFIEMDELPESVEGESYVINGDMFFHINDIHPEHKEFMAIGRQVSFRVEGRRDGRPTAKGVRINNP